MFYITGDTHRDFKRIKLFCKENKTTKEDVIIILGDVGVNFFGGIKDWSVKHSLNKLYYSVLYSRKSRTATFCHKNLSRGRKIWSKSLYGKRI